MGDPPPQPEPAPELEDDLPPGIKEGLPPGIKDDLPPGINPVADNSEEGPGAAAGADGQAIPKKPPMLTNGKGQATPTGQARPKRRRKSRLKSAPQGLKFGNESPAEELARLREEVGSANAKLAQLKKQVSIHAEVARTARQHATQQSLKADSHVEALNEAVAELRPASRPPYPRRTPPAGPSAAATASAPPRAPSAGAAPALPPPPAPPAPPRAAPDGPREAAAPRTPVGAPPPAGSSPGARGWSA